MGTNTEGVGRRLPGVEALLEEGRKVRVGVDGRLGAVVPVKEHEQVAVVAVAKAPEHRVHVLHVRPPPNRLRNPDVEPRRHRAALRQPLRGRVALSHKKAVGPVRKTLLCAPKKKRGGHFVKGASGEREGWKRNTNRCVVTTSLKRLVLVVVVVFVLVLFILVLVLIAIKL